MFSWIRFLISLLIAIMLALTPMPETLTWMRPAWVLLLLIYWVLVNPFKVSLGTAFLIGLLIDLLTGTILGEHALAMCIVVFFVARMHIRLRMAPLIQQMVSIALFVFLYQFVLYCVQGFIGELPSSSLYWLSSVTSMLLWPWVLIVMRYTSHKLKVSYK